MDWSQISQNLASLPNNPLFNFGLGMLSTPYQRTPVSFGQVLGNGVAQMDYARQLQAKQQQADMDAKLLQLKYNEAQQTDQANATKRAALSKYAATLSPDEQTLFNADPQAYITAHYKNDTSKPLFDEKDGGFVDPRTHAFTPITVGTGVPVPASVPRVGKPAPQSPIAGLPHSVQNYVANIEGRVGNQPLFDGFGVPSAALIQAQQAVESGGNPNAVSKTGAQGLAQFEPATWRQYGQGSPFDPTAATAAESKYLQTLYRQFGGNPQLALAAYNMGPGAVSHAIAPNAVGSPASATPVAPAQPGTPMTLAAYRAAQAQNGGHIATPAEVAQLPGVPAGSSVWIGANGEPKIIAKGNEEPTDQSFSQLDPQTQALIKKVAAYEVMPQNLSNYVRPGQGLTRQQILGYAALMNPDYNINNAEAANAYLKDMAKSSPTSVGGQAQSLNMILHHLGPMMQANANLSGTGIQSVNAVKNYLETKFNGNSPAGAAPANWDQGRTFVSQELGKLLKGGVASEGEVKDLESGLDAAKSPYQRKQALYNVADYVYGKIQAMTDRRDRLLGGMAPKTSLLDAQAERNLVSAYKLGGLDAPELLPPGDNYATGAAPGQQAQGGAPSAAAAPSIDALLGKYGIH